ncbi:hypothetical protein CBR_g32371 [Chara braunii]|uniref:protein disulfide-isomerase n=1 Tax=Chara braunii TaxID=69332 RepID=A0A388JYF0_CHABU|nr:hypothetical protein CBR_g32371 [Chara braunii]|eukprot:GBG62782.1 hypothetical protein CBR_g32371 [Chara braunii]
MKVSVKPFLLLLIGLLCLSHPLHRLARADDDGQCGVSPDGGCAASGGAKDAEVPKGDDEGAKDVEEGLEDEEWGVYVTDAEDPPYVDDKPAAAADAEEEEKEVEDEGPTDVVALDSTTYAETVKSKEFIMVEFYAPWCGHCKKLQPEYKVAASKIKAIYGDRVTLAKVDASVEKDLSSENEVSGLPTIFWYEKGEKIATYSGGRTADGIVIWIKKKLGDSVDVIATKDAAEEYMSQNPRFAIGYFDSLSGPEWEAFQEAGKLDDSNNFVVTTSADVAAVFGVAVKAPAVVFVKEGDAGKFNLYEGDEFTAAAIKKFVVGNNYELYYKFQEANVQKIFQSGIQRQLLFFLTAAQEEEYLPLFKKAAKSVLGEVVFVHVDVDHSESASVLNYFGVQGKEPRVVGFSTFDRKSKTHAFDKEIVYENVLSFAKDFAAGKVPHIPLSERIPEGPNDGPVKVVVGKTFDQIVLDSSKDVFLFVYKSADCERCDDFSPVIDKLGSRFKAVDSVVIAKIDGVANELARIDSSKDHPLLLLFKAGDKSADPVAYEGESNITALTKFLKDNVAIPFRLAKKEKAPEPAEGEAKDEL